jgi:aminoglycoside phosphotransferase (APT) family kinase protein
MEDLGTDSSIVATRDDARALDREPLLILDALRDVLEEHGIGEGEVDASFIGDGHSNITALLRRGGARVVIRRPPRGPLPKSAHDVLREARILAALEGTAVPVPRVLVQEEDASIIGGPFYVMDHLDGIVLGDETPPALASPEQRGAIADEILRGLIAIHDVDWRAQGLDTLARHEGYLGRQVSRFTQIWEQQATREIARVPQIAAWLADNLPETPETTLIHGDYRIGNLLFAREAPARLLGILDWEMATLGDPLADLGYLVATYADATRPPNVMSELTVVSREPGFPTRDELAERYAERTGRSIEHLRWYEVLALWKACVFLESSYRRHLSGAVDDPWFATFGEAIPELAEAAWQLTG